MLITTTDNSRTTKHYDKSISTELLNNYLSFISTIHKLGLVKTLLDRSYRIINSWTGFHNDIEETKFASQKNLFPPELIDKVLINYFIEQYNCKD